MTQNKVRNGKIGYGDLCAFTIGDRVVLPIATVSNEYPESGQVVSVQRDGLSSNEGSQWMIGVAFDKFSNHKNKYSLDHQVYDKSTKSDDQIAILPSTSLVKFEDYLADEPYCMNKSNGSRKAAHLTAKRDNALTGDVNSMTTFEKLAFENMTSGQASTGPTQPPTYHFGQLKINNKETLNDVRPWMHEKQRSKFSDRKVIPRDQNNSVSRSTSVPVVSSNISSGNASSGHTSSTNSGSWKPNSVLASSGANIAVDKLATYSPSNYVNIIKAEQDVDLLGLNSETPKFSPLLKREWDQLEVLSEDDSSESLHDGTYLAEDLEVGSMVEVFIQKVPRFGVIRWIGKVDPMETQKVAGVELEEVEEGRCDGTYRGHHYFTCPPGKGVFVTLRMCHADSRFLESVTQPRASIAFGSIDCQPVFGNVAPLATAEEIKSMFGKNKGIQGHQNSCYLDATLFSMFAFTSVFDSLLFRPQESQDIREYNEVQKTLREEVVNPLRANKFVRADRIMKLRTMLDNLSSVRGLTTEEKDPEEFLHSLLAQILRAEPFLQLSSGQAAYHYQLFVEKDEKLSLPSVQMLFEQSFLASEIKLKQIPSCLIVQMPRFGKNYKMYPRIIPSTILDITDVIDNSPRQCTVCGKLAEFECKECYGKLSKGLESIAFCTKCLEKAHSHKNREGHTSMRRLTVPSEFQDLSDYTSIPRVYLELFAVVCIETSHYVTFVRCGSGTDATWCFFDSMADRKGEQNGYNIPTVTECGDFMQWVDEEQNQMLQIPDNKGLPDLARRLLCDAYMCFYQSRTVMMYM